ncbi:uncharacterized protein [Epargyreus clarus]|uniref:uncharacterized protein n=1 Tax=Epargyreus clarus TaxID=520877 RepID=UPI003C2D606F
MDKDEAHYKHHKEHSRSSTDKNQPSLSSLIMWNVSKALEKNPHIDLRCAMRSAYERLEQDARDIGTMISKYPEERHVACAVLAWQQLGHKDTDSLYEFIESHRNKSLRNASENAPKKDNIYTVNSADVSKRPKGFIDHKPSTYCKGVDSASFDTHSLIGPVVKLPVETKFVMRVENTSPCARHAPKKTPKSPKGDVTNKVEAACCLDSECVERLKELEASTAELRKRAGNLARREAERVELLERAEGAWRDLELGYQRRLMLAEEKEDDIAKQITKLIEDRNAYKNACTTLAQQLSKRGEIVETDRAKLTKVEKEVCELACTRLRLSEESAKGDAAVAEQHCKAVQLDRDLQFKEEQARRKLLSVESVVASSRGLTIEAERAMREELGIIKEQITQVSNLLLVEDADGNRIKDELNELRTQKNEMLDDLETCKQMCDSRMQGIVDDLNKKRQLLSELKDKAIECKCKLPLDAAVEVKRTPSLAALCRCTGEESILHSCSCTSIRSTLLSNLLSDLFGGLQAELGDTGALMPCQLLKCLEDKHNWDRASIVKNNLRSFFSQLLVGELDTAIATSIEKYHATWVGVSCADKSKILPEPGDAECEGWQERALERRAQKMASQLAEQLFQERADELVQRAKHIVSSGPPPCECRPQTRQERALERDAQKMATQLAEQLFQERADELVQRAKHIVSSGPPPCECRPQTNKATAYPCLIKPPTLGGSKKNDTTYPTYMKRALQDVTLLRTQIEDLKKETVKKEDLRIMENKITKIVQQASGPDNTSANPNNVLNKEDHILKQQTINRSVNTVELKEIIARSSSAQKKNASYLGLTKKNIKKPTDINGRLLDNKTTGKTFKKMRQSYAVNLCLFDGKKEPGSGLQNSTCSNELNSWKEKLSGNIFSNIPSSKNSKPIDKILSKDNSNLKNKKSLKTPCTKKCTCFHKVPSNSSIDKLLETLLKWKGDLLNSSVFKTMTMTAPKSDESNIQEIHHNSEYSNNKKSVNICEIKQTNIQDINKVSFVPTTEMDQVPPVTTSEYIGAINLDKSNEQICKCNIKRDTEKEFNHGNDSTSNVNLLFKCLNASKCACKKSVQNDIENHGVQREHLADEGANVKVLSNIDLNNKNDILTKSPNMDICRSKISLRHKNNQTSASNFLPSDRDFLVKFLGVTLTDINDHKPSFARKVNNIIPNTENKQSELYYNVISSEKLSNALNKIKQPNETKSVDDKTQYQCKTNNSQPKPIPAEDINKNIENNYQVKKDKCSEEILDNSNSCVCCDNDNETKNLEVNTFYLLEQHLKHKLAEFRKSSCNSTCILPDEEEKVFITILDKIKHLISDCTYNVKCECSVESNTSGSWTRVNSLLEEYLKMKIKRVQCSCVPNKESLETVLPGVLKQVSHLIENDFERLKSLCKCKTNNNICEIHRKLHDSNNISSKEIINNAIKRHIELERSCVVLEDVSIQGSCNFGSDKSCDVIQMKETKEVQTSQSILSEEINSPNEVIITHCYNLQNELPLETCGFMNNIELKSEPIQGESVHTVPKNSMTSVKVQEVGKASSEASLRVPYVGYTLSCSCDNNLGSCVCSKSLSQSYVKNIDKIWKMLEINKKLLPNLSYIMHSIPKRVRSENMINFVEVNEASYVPVVPETKSIKNVSASDDEEIILKNSNDKLKHNDINDNMTSTFEDFVSVTTECLNDDDALYWYDCCRSPRNNRNEMMHKKAFYDSVYSPINQLQKGGKSDVSMKNNVTMCISKSKNCDCVMVPVCHVKMLVENIESKLVNSQCTCDSLSSQVCPLHSKKVYY